MSDQNDQTVILGAQSVAPAPAASAAEDANARNYLPIGTYIGEFEIISLIGVGGFGIVYLAHDHSLGRKVALKEYMPASLAKRSEEGQVSVRSPRHQETFEAGRRSFVNEARLLAQFDHPALVKVHRFWEANGTAFMVMPFYEGQTLKQALTAKPAPLDESAILRILDPVTEALGIIHGEECLHRDIAPDNIMLLTDGRPVLLDFGAARRVINDSNQALTVILKPGYAPVEQYAEVPGVRQGAWTDVYALAAVIYFAITRKVPPASVGRMVQGSEHVLPPDAASRYSAGFIAAVERCMAVRGEDRPQSMAEMRALFGLTGHAHAARASSPPQAAPVKTAKGGLPHATHASSGYRRMPFVIGGAALTLALAAGVTYFVSSRTATTPVSELAATQAPAAVVTPPAVGNISVLDDAFKAVVVRADNDISVALDAVASVVLNKDELKLSLSSNIGGYLYLLLWDKAEDKVYRLFPNASDPENAFAAGKAFSVPRESLSYPWGYRAEAPTGEWRVLAVVSERPRDFSKSALHAEGDVLVATRSEIENMLAGGAGINSLLGSPECKAGERCSERFGASLAVISEIEAPASKPVGK